MSARSFPKMEPGFFGVVDGLMSRAMDSLTDEELTMLLDCRADAIGSVRNLANTTEVLALLAAEDAADIETANGCAWGMFDSPESLSALLFLLSAQASQVQMMLSMAARAEVAAMCRAQPAASAKKGGKA